ncbi:hypothetical protein [Maribacter sp.]
MIRIQAQLFKSSVLLSSLFLLQSCYTYKPTPVDQIQVGKRYQVKVSDGRVIANKCLAITKDSVTFKARNTQLDFLKSDIQQVKRKRNSPITYIAGAAIPAAIIIGIVTNKEESIYEQTRPR